MAMDSAGNLKLYVDGVAVATETSVSSFDNNDKDLYIGRSPDADSGKYYPWLGWIDEVMLWKDGALSAADMAHDFATTDGVNLVVTPAFMPDVSTNIAFASGLASSFAYGAFSSAVCRSRHATAAACGCDASSLAVAESSAVNECADGRSPIEPMCWSTSRASSTSPAARHPWKSTEHVTLLGEIPSAIIARKRQSAVGSCPALADASISAVYVTTFGWVPEAFICSRTAKARLSWPARPQALMRAVKVT